MDKKFAIFVMFLLLVFLSPLSKVAFSKDSLTTAYYIQFQPPHYFIDKDLRVVGGIIYDITQELAHRAKLTVNFIQVPRKRMTFALINQTIDLYCNANPSWYKDKRLLWSLPLYATPDVLINRKNLINIEDLEQLNKMPLGTILGYTYFDLITYFDNNNLKRVDKSNPLSHWLTYNKGGIDGFVMSKLGAEHLGALVENSVIEFDYTDIYCVFSPKTPPEKYNELVKILEEMRVTGVIDDIVEYNQSIKKGWKNPTYFIE